MANFILQNALVLSDGTGFDVEPNADIFAKSRIEATFQIPQPVGSASNVEFAAISPTKQFIIDDNKLIFKKNTLSGSFTQTGNFITSNFLVINGDVSIGGILTARKIVTEVSQSVTLFESGSTLFGDSLDDIHSRTGSLSMSGSTIGLNNFDVTEISNDTTLGDSSVTALVTENVVKTYLDDQTDDFQTYQRKSFAFTGSFVSVSTASFTATSASAPSGYTATTEADFMFFVNGVIAEYDALTIQQSGSIFLLKVDNDSIGYDLRSGDEIVAFGKFNS